MDKLFAYFQVPMPNVPFAVWDDIKPVVLEVSNREEAVVIARAYSALVKGTVRLVTAEEQNAPYGRMSGAYIM